MDNIVLTVLLIAGICLFLTMLGLIDIIKKDFGSVKNKFLWHIVVLIPLVGSLIYFMLGAKKGEKITFEKK